MVHLMTKTIWRGMVGEVVFRGYGWFGGCLVVGPWCVDRATARRRVLARVARKGAA
jgi:hypothetical protein